MRVFNISPHRSGTRSFVGFCAAHGMRARHWCGHEVEDRARQAIDVSGAGPTPRELWRVFSDHFSHADVFADFPVPLVFPAVKDGIPDARFVIIRRSPYKWVGSVRSLIAGKPLTFCEGIFYENLTGVRHACIDAYSDELLIAGYAKYFDYAVDAFKDEPWRLLSMDIGDPLIGAKVSALLGFEQKYPYPHQS